MEKQLFAERLKNAREASGMSQNLMASRIGVTAATVASWEKGDSAPRANRTQMLASLLNVPLLWLLGGSQQVPETVDTNTSQENLQRKLSEVNAKMHALSASLEELNLSLQSDR